MFFFFLSKTRQQNKLKLAILDYLERYHKEDTETYTMVALHFTMYRQIASMLHHSAHQLMRQLNGAPMGKWNRANAPVKTMSSFSLLKEKLLYMFPLSIYCTLFKK